MRMLSGEVNSGSHSLTFESDFIELIQDIKRTVESGGRHVVEVE